VSVPAVAALLREANRILFITGAGMSADSGLPTYRGVGGLYHGRATDEGIAIEDALSGQMLAARPDVTWKYLWELGAACRGAKPNRGHEVIAAIEKRKPGTWVLTQNVDGLHGAAGSRNLIEIHGRSDALFCVDCARKTTPDEFLSGLEPGQAPPLPPTCPDCRGLVRPDVVLFGEMLQQAALRQYYALAGMDIEIVLSIGTTSVFPYIAEPVRQARAAGVPTVEINPARTEVSDLVDYRLETGAADALGAIGRELRLV
jgi:NAD-dependent deacetylase